MKNMRCHLCGSDLKIADIKGATFSWKDFNAVKLLVSFNALKCSKCQEILIRGDDATRLDEALEKSIRIQASDFLKIIKCESSLSQKILAKKIGITEVYFSEIIGMKKTVSFHVFNYFKLLSNDVTKLSELDNFEVNYYRLRETSINDYVNKYTCLGRDNIEKLEGDRSFKGMLGDNTSRMYH